MSCIPATVVEVRGIAEIPMTATPIVHTQVAKTTPSNGAKIRSVVTPKAPTTALTFYARRGIDR